MYGYTYIPVVKPLAICICSILVQKSRELTRSDSSHSGGTSRSSTIKVNLRWLNCRLLMAFFLSEARGFDFEGIKKFKNLTVHEPQQLDSSSCGVFVGLANSRGSWVVGKKSWVVGKKSWVVGKKSWVVGKKSWVVGKKSWVVGKKSWVPNKKSWVPRKKSWVLRKKSWVPNKRLWVPRKSLGFEAKCFRIVTFFFWNACFFL